MKLDIEQVKNMSQKILNIKYQNLEELVDRMKNDEARLKPNVLPEEGGVYIFWWIVDGEKLVENAIDKTIVLKGPNGVEVPISYTKEWILHRGEGNAIPLYIGKTTNLKKRLSLHLQLKTQRGLSLGDMALDERRKTTSNQVRDRIERIFLEEQNTRDLMIQSLGLSFVIMNGHENSVNRFYLEDKMIGELFPLFNVDIER